MCWYFYYRHPRDILVLKSAALSASALRAGPPARCCAAPEAAAPCGDRGTRSWDSAAAAAVSAGPAPSASRDPTAFLPRRLRKTRARPGETGPGACDTGFRAAGAGAGWRLAPGPDPTAPPLLPDPNPTAPHAPAPGPNPTAPPLLPDLIPHPPHPPAPGPDPTAPPHPCSWTLASPVRRSLGE